MKKKRREDVMISLSAASDDSQDQKSQKSKYLPWQLSILFPTIVLKISKISSSMVANQKASFKFPKKY